MSRRVPEFAVLTGVFLGVSTLVSGAVLAWGLYATVVVGAVVSYPFVAFGIVRDNDPAATIPPRWLLAAGAVVAVAGGVGVVVGDPTPGGVLSAVLVAALLGAPAAAYATRFGADLNPVAPRITVLAGGAAGLALLVAGLATGRPLVGAAASVLAGLGAALYGTERGVDVDARTKRLVAAGGGVVGIGIVGVGVARGGPLGPWLLVGIAAAVVPSLYAALTRARSGGSRRPRRSR
ncbi:hypothetical protein GCM10008995_09870 [Halobellus salinus]|uniref:Uncharacterized protein n=1 Tax=Halobellus salinus TaxID=931585 RepID=A0A830E8L6_9EURY|nr:hypothetical protein [Halobellus salinus]GGJ02172.1 hypothetical protein GCM10008995_09870 [Halobellus salinus]SMP17763.1 hypothetical protein SAMN06265347_10692 [Halobellus salinus]